MPKKPVIPKYGLHKPTGQARVRLNGIDHYLGVYGTEESKEAYKRKINEWSQTGISTRSGDLTIAELVDGYEDHARRYYSRNGRQTSEVHCVRSAVRFVLAGYTDTLAGEFGPLALKAVRQAMIDARLARTTINTHVHRIRKMFRWAAENQLLPASVWAELRSISALERGQDWHGAAEPEPVGPVDDEAVKKIWPEVDSVIRDMITLQRLTGMRPGELVSLRKQDLLIHPKQPCWLYVPEHHKTEWRKKTRVIVIGPKGQDVIRKYWHAPGPLGHVFVPPRAKKNGHYTVNRYWQTIWRACDRAGIKSFHPHQLRHTAATIIEGDFDLEAVRSVLSHGSLKMAKHYVARDVRKAMEVMEKIG